MFDQEVKEPISCEVDRRTTKAMRRTRQESVVEERMDEFFMPKNVKTSTLQPPDVKSFKVGAKHIKKAAKKARQKATRNGAEATMKDAWQLECTYTGCTAGVGRAPFKTPALTPNDALAYLGLHRESAHGNYAKDAEENAERINCPNHPSPEVEQVLQPARQPPAEQLSTVATEVSNTKQNRKNRSLEGNNETKQAATEDKDALTDSTSTDHTEDLVSDPNEAPTTSVTKAKMNIEKMDNAPNNASEASTVEGRRGCPD
jgi:hypothetical protein